MVSIFCFVFLVPISDARMETENAVSLEADNSFAADASGEKLTSPENQFISEKEDIKNYALQTMEKLSYDFGTIDMPLGKAWRPSGSQAEHQAAQYIKGEMKRIGLSRVAVEGFPVHGYTFKGASVEFSSSSGSTKMLAGGLGGVVGTGSDGLSAPVVYVGIGTKEDYDGKDVTGKIVLVDMSEDDVNWFHIPQYEAELHGAAGIIVNWKDYGPIDGSVVAFDSMGRQTIPAVSVSHNDFDTLKELSENSPASAVTVKSDVTIDNNASSSNVIGYLPGTVHPDQLIVVGGHYDKWWYGTTDNSGGVAQMLAIAKAMVDSGYRPDRTIVFVAHGSEEYGWTDTDYDWAIGSWSNISRNHPDWPGRTLAYFNIDDMSGTSDENTVFAGGTPETLAFRKKLIKKLNDYFGSAEPWSSYYQTGKAGSDLPSTSYDEFSYGASGIPTMGVFSANADDPSAEPDEYHTQMDNMEVISPDNLLMDSLANGLAVMEMDKAGFLPYSFVSWKNGLAKSIRSGALDSLGIDLDSLNSKMDEFGVNAQKVQSMISSNDNPSVVDKVNRKLFKIESMLSSNLIGVGGQEEALYPHEQYQGDFIAISKAIKLLEKGKMEQAAKAILDVNGMAEGGIISRDNYEEMVIGRNDPNRDDLFWAKGRLARYTDVYDEYQSLSQGDGGADVLRSLKNKDNVLRSRLNDSIRKITKVLSQSTKTLEEVEDMLD